MVRAARAKAGPSKPRHVSLQQTLAKKLHDNFRNWEAEDIDVRKAEGMSLRQRLQHDQESHAAGKEPKVMGAVYYQSLRAMYKPPPKLHELKVADSKLAISPQLVSAMCAAQRAHADRSPLTAWMQTVTAINQSEMVGLARYWMTLKVRCVKQLSCAMEAVRMCSRLKLNLAFDAEFKVVRPWIDSVLEGGRLDPQSDEPCRGHAVLHVVP